MKNWKKVEIPSLMQNLELDKRGYPIPFNVLRDKNNAPIFTANVDIIVEQCIKENLCHVCGTPMLTDTWMIGGPLSAFDPNGCYIDPPTHKACGEYALQVCPYLAVSNYNGKFTTDQINAKDFNTEENKKITFINPTLDKTRVPFFVFTRVNGFRIERHGAGRRYLFPRKPFLETEFWNDGEKITKEQATELQKEKEIQK